MGTWGPALFSDDLALKVKDDFKDKIALAPFKRSGYTILKIYEIKTNIYLLNYLLG